MQFWVKIFLLVCLLLLPECIFGEYRAYWLEVFGLRDQVKQEIFTGGWDSATYISTHGGWNEVRVNIKATWMCYGPTAMHDICPFPSALDPKFKLGQAVQVTLNKHTTYLWQGVVEVALWRQDLGSNVYGVRFPTMDGLYATYYESDLKNPPGYSPSSNSPVDKAVNSNVNSPLQTGNP